MKKITLIILTFAVVISSCNNFSADIAKRKYRKGYSVSISFKKKAEQQPVTASSIPKKDTATRQAPALVSYPFLNSQNQSQPVIPQKTEEKSQSVSKSNSEIKPSNESVEKKSVVKKNVREKEQKKRNG